MHIFPVSVTIHRVRTSRGVSVWSTAQVRRNAMLLRKREPEKYGMRSDVVVKALRYKPAGRGFDSPWCRWNF